MALKGKGLDKDNKQRKRNRSDHKLRIDQDKERDCVWEENKCLRYVPLVVVHELSGLGTEVSGVLTLNP